MKSPYRYATYSQFLHILICTKSSSHIHLYARQDIPQAFPTHKSSYPTYTLWIRLNINVHWTVPNNFTKWRQDEQQLPRRLVKRPNNAMSFRIKHSPVVMVLCSRKVWIPDEFSMKWVQFTPPTFSYIKHETVKVRLSASLNLIFLGT